jgi:hypothetical protein
MLPLLALAGPAKAEGLNNLMAGINGLLTFPADPVAMAITPPDEFEELPAHKVSGRILALPAGTLLGVYRFTMAAFDIAFTPLWLFPTMSPEPRWAVFPDVEYE